MILEEKIFGFLGKGITPKSETINKRLFLQKLNNELMAIAFSCYQYKLLKYWHLKK